MLRYLSVLCGLVLLTLVALGHGVRSEKRGGSVADAFAWAQENLRLAEREVQAVTGSPPWFLYPAEHSGNGVTRGADMDDGALILLTGFLPREGGHDYMRLIRRDGSTVASWDFDEIPAMPAIGHENTPPPSGYPHITMSHGLAAHPDGSVVFNLVNRAFVRLTRCGQPMFLLRGNHHHDLSLAEAGGYWTFGRRLLDRRETPGDWLPPHTSERFRGKTPEEIAAIAEERLMDETIVRVDKEGRPLQEFSVTKALHASGLQHLLAMKRVGEEDLTHANSIHELSGAMAAAFPMFEAGDLLLSLRDLHSLVVLDPGTRRVKWRRTGPWAWQHDARFQPDGTITLFNNAWNNGYQVQDGAPVERDPAIHSNILRLDPASGEVSVVAGREIAEESYFYTRGRGQHQMLPGGDVLVVESEAGRVVQFDPQGRRLWEFVNRHGEDQIALVVNAYVYPADYFQVDDWICPPR